MTYYFLKLIRLFGGLALFLFGMDIMGKSLERQAGGKLQNILSKMSSTVPKGFLLGMAVTAVIQSSSATTVMVVGFVNSGIMKLSQAVGVIMGSNVGTTVTAWILSLTALEGSSFLVQVLKPSTLAPALGIIGVVLYMFTKSEKKRGVGTILLGFMALMTGMEIMSDSMKFLKEEAWFANLMVSFSNPFLGIAVGAILTAVIQSSSASVGILQGLCSTGTVTFSTALPIILGQNIGTCVTALMGSIGANRNARRTAMVHLYFNVVGVLLFVLVFYGIGIFFPWDFLHGVADEMDIALIHTCFNLGATAVLLPMNKLLIKLADLTVREKQETEKSELLDHRLLATPAVAVERAHEIAGEMALLCQKASTLAEKLRKSYDPKLHEELEEIENQTDRYEDLIGTYLVKLSSHKLNSSDNRKLNTILYTIGDFERIADHATGAARAAREMVDKHISFSPIAQQELAVLEQAVEAVLATTVQAYRHFDLDAAMEVEPQEQVVDALVREIRSRHIRRLREGLCKVEYGFILDDLLTAYSRSADHCSNIAVEMLQMSEDKLDAHEYLNSLKEGRHKESAAFAQRYQSYLSRYSFPETEA